LDNQERLWDMDVSSVLRNLSCLQRLSLADCPLLTGRFLSQWAAGGGARGTSAKPSLLVQSKLLPADARLDTLPSATNGDTLPPGFLSLRSLDISGNDGIERYLAHDDPWRAWQMLPPGLTSLKLARYTL
jgi:hypothetical protein